MTITGNCLKSQCHILLISVSWKFSQVKFIAFLIKKNNNNNTSSFSYTHLTQFCFLSPLPQSRKRRSRSRSKASKTKPSRRQYLRRLSRASQHCVGVQLALRAHFSRNNRFLWDCTYWTRKS